MDYDKYDAQANTAFNNQMNQAQQNQAQAQQTYNQANNLYNKAEGQDQNEYEQSRSAAENTANEQQQLNSQIGGQQALDTFNQQQANQQAQAGYNADLNRNAMQNLNQAVGTASAYNDLLNTSGYNFGQNAGARAAAESNAQAGINNNIAAQQQVANGQQTAYTNSANVAAQATNAMLSGQQNQISNLANNSTTNLGLLANANTMYNTDLGNWVNGVNAGSNLYQTASNAVGAGASAVNSLMQGMEQESQAKIVNPSTAAANYAAANASNAQANLANVEAKTQAWQLQVAQRTYATQNANAKAMIPALNRMLNKAAGSEAAYKSSGDDKFLDIFDAGHNSAANEANSDAAAAQQMLQSYEAMGGNTNALSRSAQNNLAYGSGAGQGNATNVPDFYNTLGSAAGAAASLIPYALMAG